MQLKMGGGERDDQLKLTFWKRQSQTQKQHMMCADMLNKYSMKLQCGGLQVYIMKRHRTINKHAAVCCYDIITREKLLHEWLKF